jgi:hypothetical protein
MAYVFISKVSLLPSARWHIRAAEEGRTLCGRTGGLPVGSARSDQPRICKRCRREQQILDGFGR